MNNQIQVERIKKTRTFLLDIIKDLSIDQLNAIPPGFANNILWHLGHLIAAQQGICYVRSGLQPVVPENYILPYKSGTKPEKILNAEEAAAIKEVFFSSLDQFVQDLQNNLFSNYASWTTRYGIELTSIEEALQFLPFHEGLHAGYITYMKRLV